LDHEELVEVAGEDRQVAHPLEQRQRLVLGQLEHPLVEPQPRQLPVEEAVLVLGHRRDRVRVGLVGHLDVVRLVGDALVVGQVHRVVDDLQGHETRVCHQRVNAG
jgi:hypothetical protein